MATIKEVAQEARVSIGTVSNVITGSVPVGPKRQERVLAAIRKLGYHPDHVARSLKLRRTKMLGMVISDITNPFFSQMVRGAEDAALERNYLILTFNTDDRVDREKQVLSVLRSRRVDGILLVVAPGVECPTHIAETLRRGTPIVCLDRVPPGIKVDSVSVDNAAASRECVRHLLALGHTRIGIITGSLVLQTAQQRLQGYKEALAEARVTVRPEWIREGDFHTESGYRRGRELLMGRDRPTALFISNSLMAIGVLKALGELGLSCPHDVALATFDDLPLTEVFKPHLTAVAQPAYAIGYKGAQILIQRIEAEGMDGLPVAIRFPTELKIRESTIGYELRHNRSGSRLSRNETLA
jgi:LacI family transcriptional regulator